MIQFFKSIALSLLFSSVIIFAQANKIEKWVAPEYPQFAQLNEISGVVKVRVAIDKNGAVLHVWVIDIFKNNSLTQMVKPMVEEAARKLKFIPTTTAMNRDEIIYFGFHLYSNETPEHYLRPEFIEPNTIIIKGKVPKFKFDPPNI